MIVAYVALAVVILLFMVLVHEFGHYIVGKILKFRITEFSVGFGFPIFSHTSKKTGEKFSLRIFPLGGYCAFYGEDEEKEVVDELAFNNQKPWKRILVFLAGVTANFITSIIFSWILLCCAGYDVPQVVKNVSYSAQIGQEQVEYVNEFEIGDVFTHINGEKIDFAFGINFNPTINGLGSDANKYYNDQLKIFCTEKGIDTKNGVSQEVLQDFLATGDFDVQSFVMTKRSDEGSAQQTYYILPTIEEFKEGSGETAVIKHRLSVKIGLENQVIGAYKYGAWEGFCRSFEMAFGFAWVVLKGLWMLITFQVPITEMGGTITTISLIASYAQQSLSYLLFFIPFIAANLAVFNLLPIPALDGSHVLFTLIEWIRGKPINRKVESIIHFVGLCILFGFVIIVDILHFVL